MRPTQPQRLGFPTDEASTEVIVLQVAVAGLSDFKVQGCTYIHVSKEITVLSNSKINDKYANE